MINRSAALARSFMLVALLAGPSLAADDEALKKDLTAVIALQGLPCGQVDAVTVNADNDYTCRCKDGNRYRVYIDTAWRLIVAKQN